MFYVLHKIGIMLKSYRLIALLIIAETTIGMTFLVYSLNIFNGLKEQRAEIQNQNKDLTLKIYNSPVLAKSEHKHPVDYDDYIYLVEKIHGDVTFYIKYKEFWVSDGNLKEFDTLVLNPLLLDLQGDSVFLGPEPLELLSEGKEIKYFNPGIHYSKDTVTLENPDGKSITINIEPLPFETEDALKQISSDENLSFSRCIVFPLNMLSFLQDSFDIGSPDYFIYVRNEDLAYIDQDIKNTSEYLHGKYKNIFKYQWIKPEENFEYNSEDIKKTEALLRTTGILFLGIIFIGQGLIFRMIFKKRRKAFAVSEIYGAGKIHILTEQFGEIFSVLTAGTVIGIIIGFFISYHSSPDFVGRIPSKGYFKSVLTVFFLNIVIASLTIFLINRKNQNESPAERLKD